jgi:LruC domain-containing protein
MHTITTPIARTVRTFLVLSIALALSLGSIGCELPLKQPGAADQTVSAPFDYSSTADVTVSGSFRSGSGAALPGVSFTLYKEFPSAGVQPLATGYSTEDGSFSLPVNIPTAVTHLYLRTEYIGLPALYKMPVIQRSVSLSNAEVVNQAEAASYRFSKSSLPNLKYLGDWKTDGTPKYLEKNGDIIDAGLLARLNESLPEAKAVSLHHPEYITTTDKSLLLRERADVWVTFIHEGAGYSNVLGFYTYPKGKTPASVNDISDITVIFPNASYLGSGGGLRSGDKVYIGRFDADTEIGWVIFSNGYSGGKVTAGNWILFSNQALNGITNASLQQHNVLLNDLGFDRVILGFEDIKRTTGGDHDFNDCLFSVTSNPVKAIDTEELAKIDVPTDTDGDGVSDSFDEFPKEGDKAFSSYTPAKDQFNTLAFEDLWPGRGDEDYNDLVMGYNARYISNAKNQVVSVELTYAVRAIGANYALGFGVELPIDEWLVRSVDRHGKELTGQQLNANGTEAGQPYATIILFDNAYKAMNHTGSKFINTVPGGTTITPETLNVTIEFDQPVDPVKLGTAPFNPFIFVNKRSKEVHLANKRPTALADQSYFGKSFDKSDPKKDTYYLSREGKAWGLNIPGSFDYPIERSPIQSGYLTFDAWVKTGGRSYSDWYSNLSGYRDASKLWK